MYICMDRIANRLFKHDHTSGHLSRLNFKLELRSPIIQRTHSARVSFRLVSIYGAARSLAFFHHIARIATLLPPWMLRTRIGSKLWQGTMYQASECNATACLSFLCSFFLPLVELCCDISKGIGRIFMLFGMKRRLVRFTYKHIRPSSPRTCIPALDLAFRESF